MSAGTVTLGVLALVWFAVALVIAVVNIAALLSKRTAHSVYVDVGALRRRQFWTVLVAVAVQILTAVVVVVAW